VSISEIRKSIRANGSDEGTLEFDSLGAAIVEYNMMEENKLLTSLHIYVNSREINSGAIYL
jgi:hypothetical protein